LHSLAVCKLLHHFDESVGHLALKVLPNKIQTNKEEIKILRCILREDGKFLNF